MAAAAPHKPWARLGVVGAALALGAFIDLSAHARAIEVAVRALETATVVQYLVLAGVSVFAAQWMTVLLVNVASGTAYLVATRRSSARSLTARVAAVLLSRQLGYLQALFPWVILAMAFPLPAFLPEWTLRAGAVVTAFALGAPLADLLARRVAGWSAARTRKKAEIEADPLAAEWHAQDERQLSLFALSLVGFAGLFLLAPRQTTTLLPLLGAFVSGFPFRVVERWRHPEGSLPAHGISRDVWRRTLDTGRRFDLTLVVVSQLVTAGIFWLKLSPALTADERDRSARTEALRIVPAGASPALAPVAPPIRLFLVSDTHFHELAGARTGVQLDLADALVRVAVRPVELDLLSGFTLMRFARARTELASKLGAPLPWAHLGDDGDLGCTSELDRMGTFVGLFGAPPVVLVPGNHDSAFVGNFAWHAAWDGACAPSPRSTKTVGDAILRAYSPRSQIVQHFPSRTALAAVQRLGQVGGVDVVGAFVDTSDSSTIAIAGVQGAVSSAQADLVRGELAKYTHPWVIVFMHHPFDELTWDSQQRVGQMVSGDKGRTLGVVSAHTHVAALRWITLDKETLPEFVIGSTTDPPQEAALLEVGAGAAGGLALRVVTIPAVARPGTTCDDVTTTVPAATCRAVFERAKATCNLVMTATGLPVEGTHPQSPAALKDAQQVRAHALLACLDRLEIMPSGSAASSAAPLDDPALFPQIDALATKLAAEATPAATRKLDELACFAWAGATLQEHKFETGWSYAHALDVAPDARAVFSATEMTYDVTTKTSTQRACGSK